MRHRGESYSSNPINNRRWFNKGDDFKKRNQNSTIQHIATFYKLDICCWEEINIFAIQMQNKAKLNINQI